MRARNIKPSLFKNEVLGVADPLLTIVFEGLWCEADREGRLEDRPLRLRAEILPYRYDADMEQFLTWLAENGFISRYVAKGTKVIQIMKFHDHQRPHVNEAESVLPAMDESQHHQGDKSALPKTQALRSDSPSLIPDSGSLIPDPPIRIPVPSEPVAPKGATAIEPKPPDLKAEAVERVFDHWRDIHRKPRANLDPKRRKLIRAALSAYSEADLCQAISGYANSPHHMGQNERSTVYDDIELMLRDSKHIDAGLQFHVEPPRTDLSAQTKRIVAATEDWEPPEVRAHAAR